MNLTRAFTILVLLLGVKLSAQVTSILGTDIVSASRTTINNNFTWVNTHIVSAAFASPSASDQVPITTGANAGAWYTWPTCTDTGGQHLNYDPSNSLKLICGSSSNAIASLNGLTEATQVFAIGTSGTDFTIVSNLVSSVATHTFNFPSASASNRGLLLAADWSTFNGKQNALGFTPENSANKGAASGYAALDSGSHLPTNYFPSTYPGNSATTTAFASAPSGCTGNLFAISISTSGNANCAQPNSGNLSDNGNILFKNQSFTYGAFTSDFSGGAHTLPWKVGTIAQLPITCTPGEGYFETNAPAGQQLLQCSALNTWTAFGSAATQASSAFQAALGYVPANVSLNLSDLTSASTARSNMGVAIGTNVEAWSATLDSWATKTVPAGTVADLTTTQTMTGKTVDGISPTILNYLVNVTSDVQAQINAKQAALAVANIMFVTSSFAYGNFTADFSGSAHTLPWKVGALAARPSTCSVGEAYFASDATPGQAIYECSGTNAWTQQLNSGAGSGNSLYSPDGSITIQGTNTNSGISVNTTNLNILYPQLAAPNTFGAASAPNIFVPSSTTEAFRISAAPLPTAPTTGAFAVDAAGNYGGFDGQYKLFPCIYGSANAFPSLPASGTLFTFGGTYCGTATAFTAANVVRKDASNLMAAPIIFPASDLLFNNSFTASSPTANHLACLVASNTVGNCTGAPSATVIGVFDGTVGNIASVGPHPVALDASTSVVFNDIVCGSSSSPGTGHDNGATPCALGNWVGIVQTTAASVTTAAVYLRLQ